MTDYVAMVGSLARQRMQQAYDSLWKAFELKRQQMAGLETRKLIEFINADPQTKQALAQPTYHALETLVGLGAVSVPEAVQTAIMMKREELQHKALMQDYINKQALQELYEAQIEQTKQNTWLKRHEVIDSLFNNIMKSMSSGAALVAQGQLAAPSNTNLLQAFSKVAKYFELMRLRAHEIMDSEPVVVMQNGKQASMPHSPYGAAIQALNDTDPQELYKLGITAEELATVYQATGFGGLPGKLMNMIQQHKEINPELAKELAFWTMFNKSYQDIYTKTPSDVLQKLQGLLEDVKSAIGERNAPVTK